MAAGKVRLLVGDIEVATGLGAFDRIYSANVFQFWKNPAAVIAELFAITNPGGVVATTYQPRHSGATDEDALEVAEQIKGHLETAGFQNIRIERNPLKPLAVCVLGSKANGT